MSIFQITAEEGFAVYSSDCSRVWRCCENTTTSFASKLVGESSRR